MANTEFKHRKDFMSVTIIGRTTNDAEIFTFETEKGERAVTKFGFASNNFKEDETLFINCKYFNSKGLEIAKGTKLLVNGRLKTEKWETENGDKKSAITFDVEGIEFLTKKKDAETTSSSSTSQASSTQSANNDSDDDGIKKLTGIITFLAGDSSSMKVKGSNFTIMDDVEVAANVTVAKGKKVALEFVEYDGIKEVISIQAA